jgi:hypothetical protein
MGPEQIIANIQYEIASLGTDAAAAVPDIITALVLIALGLFIGKFSKWFVKKTLLSGLKLELWIKKDLTETVLTSIKWVIYVVFLRQAFVVLKIPILSEYLSTVLGIIQGLAASIVILVVGYGVALYLKRGIEKIAGWQLLGSILFLFILYISLTVAVRSAFGSEKLASNVILIITAAGASALAWNYKDAIPKKR